MLVSLAAISIVGTCIALGYGYYTRIINSRLIASRWRNTGG